MNTHEYQAKKILLDHQIAVPPFFVVTSLAELESLLDEKGWDSVVLKVQVHAGGRGKAGGVRLVSSRAKIMEAAKELLGMKVVNEQTGPEGMIAHALLVCAPIDIAKEYYLGMIIDRKSAQSMLIASPAGGMDIEKVAKESPDQVLTLPVPANGFFRSYQLLRIAKFMGWTHEIAREGMDLVKKLVMAFAKTDATLLEINPLVLTSDGKLCALDAKLSVDDNALFRQVEIKGFFDPSQVSPQEARAHEYDLAYVALEGEIGCMVNGAGLAMATMDIIHHYGGHPANFLDVGGSATKEKVAEGFKIILKDPKVKGILVNIFGGIMSCDTVAEGIVEAAKELHIHVPLVIRIEGTNVEKGKKIIEGSSLKNIQIAPDLTQAAKLILSTLQGDK